MDFRGFGLERIASLEESDAEDWETGSRDEEGRDEGSRDEANDAKGASGHESAEAASPGGSVDRRNGDSPSRDDGDSQSPSQSPSHSSRSSSPSPSRSSGSSASRSSRSDRESGGEERGEGDEGREGGDRGGEEAVEGGYAPRAETGEGGALWADGDKGSPLGVANRAGGGDGEGRDAVRDGGRGRDEGERREDQAKGLGVNLDFDDEEEGNGSDYNASSDGEGSGTGSDRSGGGEGGEGEEQQGGRGEKRKGRGGTPEGAVAGGRAAKRMGTAGEAGGRTFTLVLGSGGAASSGSSVASSSTGLLVQQVADHYSRRDNQLRHEREASPIIHLKKLNNWVKSVLIRLHTNPRSGARVLDLACGKGGDLNKWARANVGFYFGVDVAEGSVHDAMARYNGDSDDYPGGGGGRGGGGRGGMGNGEGGGARGDKQLRFPAKLACADCFGVALDRELAPWAPFDICSTQFALHYSFETEERARCGLRNVAALLRPGGMFIGTLPDANVLVQKLRAAPGRQFGNKVYQVEFAPEFEGKTFPRGRVFGIRYEFHLEDAVDCPEWLVPFPFLCQLAGEYGLKLEYHANFHEFIKRYAAEEPHASLVRRIVGPRWREEMTPDEWDAAYLYCVFVFRKVGEEGDEGGEGWGRRDEVCKRLESDDIMIL